MNSEKKSKGIVLYHLYDPSMSTVRVAYIRGLPTLRTEWSKLPADWLLLISSLYIISTYCRFQFWIFPTAYRILCTHAIFSFTVNTVYSLLLMSMLFIVFFLEMFHFVCILNVNLEFRNSIYLRFDQSTTDVHLICHILYSSQIHIFELLRHTMVLATFPDTERLAVAAFDNFIVIGEREG